MPKCTCTAHSLCNNSVYYLQLCLHIPQLLLGLSSLAIGVAQPNLHLIQVSLHLLLDSQGIVSAPDLRIQSALHGVNHPLAVPLDLLHLLIFLCQLPVHLTLNLVEFQLDTQDLRLFVFQSSLMISNNSILIFAFKPFNVYLSMIGIFLSRCPQKKRTSASSRAVWISDFSVSTCFLDFSSSWILLPVSPICSVRSEISSAERYMCFILLSLTK